MSEATFRNIQASVRSPRCAVLVDSDLPYWTKAAKSIISSVTQIWGGAHFILVPTDGETISDKFWEILEAYSPDHIAIYRPSLTEYAEFWPDKYSEVREQSRQKWVEQRHGTGFDEWFERSARSTILGRFAVSETLSSQLAARLGSFHHSDSLNFLYLNGGSAMGYPTTRVSKINEHAMAPFETVYRIGPTGNEFIDLLLFSRVGYLTQNFGEELLNAGLNIENVGMEDLAELVTNVHREQQRPAGEGYPFDLSMLHLGTYYRVDLHAEHREPTIVVLGDSFEDFCLYYTMSRLHLRIFWLPLSLIRSLNTAVLASRRRYLNDEPSVPLAPDQKATRSLINYFFESIDYGHDVKRIALTSATLSQRQLVAYRTQIDRSSYSSGELGRKIDCVPLESVTLRCIASVFESENYNIRSSLVFVGGKSIGVIDTPKPKNFKRIALPDHHWLTSITVDGYHLPTIPAIGDDALEMSGERRAARDGLVYQCPHWGYFGGDVDTNTVRPRLTILGDEEIVDAFFRVSGMRTGRSDKGNYLNDTLTRFGGLERACNFLRDDHTRGVLDLYLQKSAAEDGSVVYLKNDQRSYVTLDGFIRTVGVEELAVSLIDDLIRDRVLQRGYIFNCERCRLSSWYSLNSLDHRFVCNRCDLRQQFTAAHWKKPFEPQWFYRLAETVYQTMINNSHVTILALGMYARRAKRGFHFVPELELYDLPNGEAKREIDIACILDGEIIIGECKTEALKPKHTNLFKSLAQVLTRKPDRFVFATDKAVVSPEFMAAMAKVPGSQLLTRANLLA